MQREKRAEGVLEDVSNEEGENNKREEGDEEKEENKERGEKVLPTKTKSQLAREAKRETPATLIKDILILWCHQRNRGNATLLASSAYSRS